MKTTDLKIGEFATRNWYNGNNKSLCIKRYSEEKYEYWKNGQFSSAVREDSSIFNKNDFMLCDCNGQLIKKFTYPLYMESIIRESRIGRVVKFDSLNSGKVIIQGNSNTLAGYKTNDWVEHTRIDCWKPCDFSKAPEIEDLDFWDARYNAGLPVYYSKDNYYHIRHKFTILPSKLMELNKTKFDMLYIEQIEKFTYPMYFECIKNSFDKGIVVKFTELNKGKFIKKFEKNEGIEKFLSTHWVEHTDKEIWKQVDFDETIDKIIPTQDDIDELISDLKSIIEDDDNRFSPSEYGAGTQLKESGYDQCRDLIDEWMEKYHLTKAPDVDNEKDFTYFGDLLDIIMYIENTIQDNEPDEPIIGVDYASQPDIAFVPQEGIKSRLNDDALDALSYTNNVLKHLQQDTGATENVVKTNYNKTKEFTMNNELKEAILELIATNGKPKVKKPKTPKIVCNVEGALMEFADEAALKQFMWSSRVESVIRYDLTGKVTVPFELSVEAPKKQKQTKVTE